MKDNSDDKLNLQDKGWLKLDNCAKLFPAIISRDLTSVFRITASLCQPVKYSELKKAVELTSGRFPYFSVSLGSGLFWHFLEFNKQVPRIELEGMVPCAAFAINRKNEPLYRILVRSNRISVEFIHILTDGAGALEYLRSLLYTYFTLAGEQIRSAGDIMMPGTPVQEEELEDGYQKYYRKLPPPDPIVKAWHLPFRLSERPRLKILRAEVKSDEMLKLARSHKVSVTDYFLAVYLFSLQKIFLSFEAKGARQKQRMLRIELPVNLRNKLPSRTMRNFTLFVLPEIDMRLGTYTFDEVLQSVHHQLQIMAETRQISRFLSQNVNYEKLLFVRILPLFIKKIAIAAIYRGFAACRFTGLVSNLGRISLPPEMEELVDSFEIIPPPPNPKVKVCGAMVSFKGRLRITFCNLTSSVDLERSILLHLQEAGVHVKILKNG